MSDLAQLAALDPARGREPSAQEWARSREHLQRVVSGAGASAPAHAAPSTEAAQSGQSGQSAQAIAPLIPTGPAHRAAELLRGRTATYLAATVLVVALAAGLSAVLSRTGASSGGASTSSSTTSTFSGVGQFTVVQTPLSEADLPGAVQQRRQVAVRDATAFRQDHRILDQLTGPTGMGLAQLQQAIHPQAVDGQTVEVTFTAGRPEQVEAYFAAMRDIFAPGSTTDPLRLAHSDVVVLSLPDHVTTSSRGG